MKTTEDKLRRNLKRIVAESVFTSIGAGFSCATMTVFWNSIGMDQTAIGFVQMIYTLVVLFLDIPMGYFADKINRKIFNIIGDFGIGIAFVVYALSQNMYMAIIAECMIGVFTAMTNGVDSALLRSTADAIDPSHELLEKTNARMHTMRYVMLLIVMVIGGFVAKVSLRLTIALSFIPYFMGALIALKIDDYGEKSDKKKIIKSVLKSKKTRAYMMCYILGKEITHPYVWLFTPLLMQVGVPFEIVSLGWVLKQVMVIIGGKISETKMLKYRVSKRFAIPMLVQLSWIIILGIRMNIITVWLFALNGFVQGLVGGSLVAPLQISSDKKIQTSVMSMASTGARLFYIPMVYLSNYLGNIKLQLGLVGVAAIYLPICFAAYILLRKIEKGKIQEDDNNEEYEQIS